MTRNWPFGENWIAVILCLWSWRENNSFNRTGSKKRTFPLGNPATNFLKHNIIVSSRSDDTIQRGFVILSFSFLPFVRSFSLTILPSLEYTRLVGLSGTSAIKTQRLEPISQSRRVWSLHPVTKIGFVGWTAKAEMSLARWLYKEEPRAENGRRVSNVLCKRSLQPSKREGR